jgi:HEAT repeat protein
VRRYAVLALGKLSAFDQTDAIKKLYRNETEEQNVKLAAAAALLSLNDEEGLIFLRENSKNKKNGDRKYIAEILGKAPSKQGTVLLIEMVNNKNRDVRIQAISFLGFSKDKSGLPHLHNLLEDSDYRIRAAAVEALGNITSPESIEFLQRIATDTQERVPTRLSAITGLGNIGTEETVDALLKILENEKETYQFRAITALGNIRSARAIVPLNARLGKERKRKAEWREIRDEDTESYTEEQIRDWRERLEKVKPRTYLEFELSYAISRIAPETQGTKLLSHDLAAVREGAWTGLGKAGTVSLIQKLHTERKKSGKPWFCHAAYRAIDHILINIQAFGGKKELEQLETLFPKMSEKQSLGVHTRVEWTIDRLKDRESKGCGN